MTNERNSGFIVKLFIVMSLMAIMSVAIAPILETFDCPSSLQSTDQGGEYVEVPVISPQFEYGISFEKEFLSYSYDYGGKQYEADAIEASAMFFSARDSFINFNTGGESGDLVPIRIFVDTSKPQYHRVEIRYVARQSYNKFQVRKGVIVLSLIGLFFCLKPKRRVQDLIPE